MKRTMISMIAVLLLAVLCVFVHGCAPKDNKEVEESVLSKLEKTGILDVGYVVWPPTVIKNPNTGDLSGHFIDTIEYIANEIKVKIRWHEATWATFVAGLHSGRYDVAVAGTYKTIGRAKTVAYTRPLFYIGNSVLVKSDEERFETVSDLNRENIRIAVTQGTGEHDFAEKYLVKAKKVVLPSADLTLPLLEVTSGRVDAAISDTHTIKQFLRGHSELKGLFIEDPINMTGVAWTVRPDDQRWVNFLNDSLEYLEASGRLKEFERKYDAQWLHKRTLWE